MARLIYSMIMSLDGYVEDEAGAFGWGAPDPEVHTCINELASPFGTRVVNPNRVNRRLAVSMVVLGLHLGGHQFASAQQTWLPPPDRDDRFGPNRISVGVGVLGVSAGYSRQLSRNVEWGLAVSGGAQTGFMLFSGELTGDAAVPLFVELLAGAAYVRGDVGGRTELEGGARVGWFFHTTEYETVFSGLYTALQYRLGAARLGPRLYWGRIAEESGRSDVGFAVVPLLLSFRWSW